MPIITMAHPLPVNAGPITPTPSAALTGTITSSTTAADIVTGGKTIILTLTNDTFLAFDDTIRTAIVNGTTSAQSEATGWNLVVKPALLAGLAAVVRTADTVCTITLPACASYSVAVAETITVTIPATALTGASPVIAAPAFGVEPNAGWSSIVAMTAANYTTVMSNTGLANITTDGTYVRMTYPNGLAPGTSPGTLYKSIPDAPIARIRIVGMRLSSSPAFYINTAGQNKIGFLDMNTASQAKKFVPQTFGSGTGAVRLGFSIQDAVSGNANYGNGDGPVVTRGTILDEIIWEVGRNTAGTADGYARMYYNGVLVVSATGIQWSSDLRAWNNGQWDPLYGGASPPSVGTPPVTADFYEELQEFHLEVPV